MSLNFSDVKKFVLNFPRTVFRHTVTAMVVVGTIPAIAIMNVFDEETWKRGAMSVSIGVVCAIASLPLLPFLVVGIAGSMLEDKFLS